MQECTTNSECTSKRLLNKVKRRKNGDDDDKPPKLVPSEPDQNKDDEDDEDESDDSKSTMAMKLLNTKMKLKIAKLKAKRIDSDYDERSTEPPYIELPWGRLPEQHEFYLWRARVRHIIVSASRDQEKGYKWYREIEEAEDPMTLQNPGKFKSAKIQPKSMKIIPKPRKFHQIHEKP